jgi:DNA-binding HxlR family transcriptional regulator
MNHQMAGALRLVSGKWKIALLGQLAQGPLRYGRLLRLFPQVSTKVFTQQLRALERDGLISRTQGAESAQWVEYAITSRGTALWISLEPLAKWAEQFHRETTSGTRSQKIKTVSCGTKQA